MRARRQVFPDRKSTRLNSSHLVISYAVFCLKKKIPDMASSNGAVRGAAERMAINMPIQGTAADIMKIAMVKVHARLRDAPWARAVLQVHDKLVFEVERSRVDDLAELAREEMGSAYPLDVPLVVDIRSGANWDDMTPLAAAKPGLARA